MIPRRFVPTFALIATLCAAPVLADSLADELSSKVLIRRDAYGVPHILGETEEAAIFGYGYAAAEDRCLEIARLMLKARGEEARYFGEEYADSDLTVKRFRNHEIAQAAYDATDPWFQRILDAYALGYNRYVEQNRDDLPRWVVPITGVDAIAHVRRVTVMEFCMNLRQIAGLGREDRAERRENELIGSNMWAINKHRSSSGNALLLGNPHLAWSGSHVWHEAHITVPGEINFMGAALIGTAAPALGWNDRLGWSHTVNPHDCDDIYVYQLDADHPGHYLYEGRPEPLERFDIQVDVETDEGVETRVEDAYWTHHGPVVKRDGDTIYAYKAASLREGRMAQQWYSMTKARDLDEFRSILDMQAVPMFNIAYADVDGNCFYLYNGRFPDRPDGVDWSGPVKAKAETEWNRVLPQARLPQLLNPATGYVQNSNSSPWYTNLSAIIDRTKYPEDVFGNSNSLRTQHGQMLIERNESISFEEILRDKYSMRLLAADRVKPDLLNILEAKRGDPTLGKVYDVLAAWDNTVSRDSRGSVLFTTFCDRYAETAEPVYEVAWDPKHPAATPHGIGDAEAAIEALQWAAEQVEAAAGAIDVAWGDVHRLRHGDVDVPIGGTTGEYGAFRIVGYREADDGKRVAVGGDSYVFAVEFSDPIKTRSILAYSQSGNPDSPHYDDQCETFAANGWKPTFFNEDELAKNIERTYRP